MKTFVALCAIVAIASAAPQVYHHSGPESTAQILRSTSDVGPESYQYQYETSNQIQANEQGQLKQTATGPAIAAQGAFSYVSPEGIPISLSYAADENGFQPQGAHLPQPHPIPPAIQRAIQWTLANLQPQYQQ